MLLSVGFSDEKQQDPVASLSGGWKMKLELARTSCCSMSLLTTWVSLAARKGQGTRS
jgi:elongation factor 3